MKNNPTQFSDFLAALQGLPYKQILFLGLAAVTWLIGGNILVATHYKRIGKPWFSGFRPFAFPFGNFNLKEWLILFGLAVLTFAFGIIGIS